MNEKFQHRTRPPSAVLKLLSSLLVNECRLIPDDGRIVSHDASRLGLYYHCVRDVIIYFTLSRLSE